MTDRCYYVYVHRRATDGSIFYVGKGKGKRAESKWGRSSHWHNVVNKNGYICEIIKRFDSEACAFSFEKMLISIHGRNNLVNKTDGGEGVSGRKYNGCERIAAMARMLGRKNTEKHIAAVVAFHTGRKRTQETCDLISNKAKERLANPKKHWHTTEEVCTWWHEKGLIRKCTHLEIAKEFGFKIEAMRKVQSGAMYSYKGWKVVGVRNYCNKKGINCNTADQTIYIWRNTISNFIGTRSDFANAMNVKPIKLQHLIKGKTKTCMGWSVKAL